MAEDRGAWHLFLQHPRRIGAAVLALFTVIACGGEEAQPADTSCAAGSYDDDLDASTPCAPWTECAPGQYVSAEGSATADRSCAGCASGTFSTIANATGCVPWSACAAGTYVTNTPSNSIDRTCAACAPGTYTSGENQASCLPHGSCLAGTVQTAPGSSTSPPVCATCAAGTYCAGGDAPAAPCADDAWDHDADPATTCAPRTDCAPGQHVSAPGSATADRTCAACASGSFSAAENAPNCTPWATCVAGTRVTNTPSDTVDRACAACEPGTYSSGENHASCVPQGSCLAGTVQTAPGSSTSPPVCATCAAGSYCAGGDAPLAPCAADDWDHDADPATTCAPRTDCTPGHHVTADGSATADRTCAACTSGGFSTAENAPSCTAWTECPPGYVEATAGTTRSDRTCRLAEWIRQFGAGNSSEIAHAVSVGADGLIAVAGRTTGALPGQTSAGSEDAFVRVYDPAGNVRWTRQFGSPSGDISRGVAIDGSGHIVVAGQTNVALPGQTSAGLTDAFVRAYDAVGNELWTRQFGSSVSDSCTSVSVDGDGTVVVAGRTNGVLPSQTSAGFDDAFVRAYDAVGSLLWTRQFGSSRNDSATAVSVNASGNIVVAGYTLSSLPGQTGAGNTDAFVRTYDILGNELWTRQFGSSSGDIAYAVSVDASGTILVAGQTNGTLPGQTTTGSADAFVRTYDALGAPLATRQFGTTADDIAYAVSRDGSGAVVVAGATDGDAFVERMGL